MVVIVFERFTRRSLSALQSALDLMRPRILVTLFAIVGVLSAAPMSAQDSSPFADCKALSMQSRGRTQQLIDGRPGAFRFTLEGSVEFPVRLVCDDVLLQATTIIYESDSKRIWANEAVSLQQPGLILSATRAEMDGHTKLG